LAASSSLFLAVTLLREAKSCHRSIGTCSQATRNDGAQGGRERRSGGGSQDYHVIRGKQRVIRRKSGVIPRMYEMRDHQHYYDTHQYTNHALDNTLLGRLLVVTIGITAAYQRLLDNPIGICSPCRYVVVDSTGAGVSRPNMLMIL
ncbi:unnamed protein product, partial [Ectocarpus sp. 12 AP-2014]